MAHCPALASHPYLTLSLPAVIRGKVLSKGGQIGDDPRMVALNAVGEILTFDALVGDCHAQGRGILTNEDKAMADMAFKGL